MTEPAWKRNGRNGPLDWWLGCQTHGDQWNEHCMSCGIALDHNIDFKARLEREKAADGVKTGEPRGPVHSCKNCAHLAKDSCDDPCAGCTVRWRSGVSDRWEPAPGMGPSAGARPLSEWHEDDGPVTWWKFPVDEPAWIGTPNSSDWPGYHTHWTPHPPIPFGVQVAHTNHPMRHYDRTCPACNPDGVNGGGNGWRNQWLT